MLSHRTILDSRFLLLLERLKRFESQVSVLSLLGPFRDEFFWLSLSIGRNFSIYHSGIAECILYPTTDSLLADNAPAFEVRRSNLGPEVLLNRLRVDFGRCSWVLMKYFTFFQMSDSSDQ